MGAVVFSDPDGGDCYPWHAIPTAGCECSVIAAKTQAKIFGGFDFRKSYG